MDYQITFAPDLALNPADFVATWNGTPDCRVVGEARVGHAPGSKSFDPNVLFDPVLVVLGSIAVNVASNAIYDLIKHVLVQHGIRKRTEITQLDQPDGSRLLVVQVVEE